MSKHDDTDDIIVNKFTEESAKDFRRKMIKRAQHDPSMPIIVYVDSYGGSMDALNSMLETIEQVPNEIVTVCMGKAMSAGAVLLSAGDIRFCGRKSRVMIHQGSSGAIGPIEGLQNDVNEFKRMNREMIKFLAQRCGMTVSDFRKEKKSRLTSDDDEARDLYLTAKAAKELGIIDYIGMPHIKPMVMYSIEPAPEKKYKSVDDINAEAESLLAEQAQPKKKTKKKSKKKATKKKKTTKKA